MLPTWNLEAAVRFFLLLFSSMEVPSGDRARPASRVESSRPSGASFATGPSESGTPDESAAGIRGVQVSIIYRACVAAAAAAALLRCSCCVYGIREVHPPGTAASWNPATATASVLSQQRPGSRGQPRYFRIDKCAARCSLLSGCCQSMGG